MESVVFDGKEYVKASVLAQKFRYTQDYLGQLCRGRKVDARLVGRAWYINLESLEKHREAKYKTVPKAIESTPKKASSNYLSRIDVEPVLKNKTVKVFKEKDGVVTELPVRYEKDEYSLIPRVNKNAVSVELPILPAEAETLKIKKEAKRFTVTDFKPEALPEVYLSGSVQIQGLTEATKSIEDEKTEKSQVSDITNKIKPERQEIEKRIVSIRPPKRRITSGRSVDMKPASKVVTSVVLTRPVSQEKSPEKPVVQVKPEISKVNPVPLGVKNTATVPVKEIKETEKKKQITFSPDVVVLKQAKQASSPERSGVWGVALLLVIFIFSIGMSVSVLAIKTEVVVSRDSGESSFKFDWSNVSRVSELFR